jgi:hypothetical protein
MRFDIINEFTEGCVVTIRVEISGSELVIMGEPKETGRKLVVEKAHFGYSKGGSNSVGLKLLRDVARGLMEIMDYDELIIEGEIRTTGANPGQRPNPLRFTRTHND